MTSPYLGTPCPDRSHSPIVRSGRYTCDHCTEGRQPSPLAAAIAARDEALSRTSAAPTVDPDEWQAFLGAVRKVAAEHDGVVDANKVRPLIRGRIQPKHIATAYRVAKQLGVLVPNGINESTDAAGKNAGRPQPLYRIGSAA